MQNINLTDHFLIAMPGLEDSFFARALTYICEHNERGALGLVVNRPTDLSVEKLLLQLGMSPKDSASGEPAGTAGWTGTGRQRIRAARTRRILEIYTVFQYDDRPDFLYRYSAGGGRLPGTGADADDTGLFGLGCRTARTGTGAKCLADGAGPIPNTV